MILDKKIFIIRKIRIICRYLFSQISPYKSYLALPEFKEQNNKKQNRLHPTSNTVFLNRFDAHTGLGLDYIFLPSISFSLNAPIICRSKFKLSIGNEISGKILFIMVLTDHPFVKLETKISRFWLTSSIDPEFANVYFEGKEYYFNYRINIGIKYKRRDRDIEWSIPFRYNDESK